MNSGIALPRNAMQLLRLLYLVNSTRDGALDMNDSHTVAMVLDLLGQTEAELDAAFAVLNEHDFAGKTA